MDAVTIAAQYFRSHNVRIPDLNAEAESKRDDDAYKKRLKELIGPKPATAYMRWCQTKRDEMRHEVDKDGEDVKITVKELGKLWKKVGAKEKAALDKEYREALEVYHEQEAIVYVNYQRNRSNGEDSDLFEGIAEALKKHNKARKTPRKRRKK